MKRKSIGSTLVLAVLLLVGGWAVSGITPVAHARPNNGAFAVNSSADTNFGDNWLTLREAILVANGSLLGPFTASEQTQLGNCTFDSFGYITGNCGSGFFDAITFTGTVTQVVLASQLPTLTDAGTFINGVAGVPRINAVGSSGNVFTINGNDITIANVSIVNGDNTGTYPNIFADIYVQGGKDTRIAYDYLGTVPGASNCTPSGVTKNSAYGVSVAPNASGASGANNAVAFIYGNTIGCHGYQGIYVLGADYVSIGMQPDTTTPDGNYIGVTGSSTNIANNADGVFLQSNGSDGVRYGQIISNTIRNNGGNGILISGTGANNTTSAYFNVMGANTIISNALDGIALVNGSYLNWIGSVPAYRNYLESNGLYGVRVDASNGNNIYYNYIGTNGVGGYFNGNGGIRLTNGSFSNSISNNVISGNYAGQRTGVYIENSNSNLINSNKIGTDPAGAFAIPNGYGIVVSNSANNTIGGSTRGDANLISGNTDQGVYLVGSSTTGTIINNNLIGLNATGTAAIPNHVGIALLGGTHNNWLGDSVYGSAQYISGNLGDGIYLENTNNNSIGQSVIIGYATDNVTPMGNGGAGLVFSTNSTNNNVLSSIGFNLKNGVVISTTSSISNAIQAAVFRNNVGLPIDLGNDGFTRNGLHLPPGPNNWLPYPVVTAYVGSTVSGKACANCKVLVYGVDDSTNSRTLITSAMADGSGNWSASPGAGLALAFVACEGSCVAGSNSSEMSPRAQLFLPLILR